MVDVAALLLEGPLAASALQARLNISQASLSRAVQQNRQILKWGKARATRYALLRPLRGESAIPLWRVSEQGKAASAGTLHPVWPQGSFIFTDINQQAQFFSGLPWFLSDMRPQGFLGRAWGREHAGALGLNPDIRLWNDEQCLLALMQNGEDMPGDWLLGNAAYQRWLTQPVPEPVARENKADRYPEFAAQALAGEDIGSSAGGEQSKFSCYAETEQGAQHCLVKFTPERDNENSQRWRDLLRAEHLALSVMRQHGLATAESELIESQGQLFLEIRRFDRMGSRGRRGMVSLEAVSAEFHGRQSHWPAALSQLAEEKQIDAESASRGTLQWAFGRLIANSDMHAGNLSFFISAVGFILTPAYDMLPMALAPNSQGYMRDNIALRLDLSLPRNVWLAASGMAKAYWQILSADPKISSGFREIARQASGQLQACDDILSQMA